MLKSLLQIFINQNDGIRKVAEVDNAGLSRSSSWCASSLFRTILNAHCTCSIFPNYDALLPYISDEKLCALIESHTGLSDRAQYEGGRGPKCSPHTLSHSYYCNDIFQPTRSRALGKWKWSTVQSSLPVQFLVVQYIYNPLHGFRWGRLGSIRFLRSEIEGGALGELLANLLRKIAPQVLKDRGLLPKYFLNFSFLSFWFGSRLSVSRRRELRAQWRIQGLRRNQTSF